MFCMKMVRNWGPCSIWRQTMTNPHHITVDLFSAANVYRQPRLAWGSKWDTMWILASKNQWLAHDARKSSGVTITTNICSANVPHVTSFKLLVCFFVQTAISDLHCVYIHRYLCRSAWIKLDLESDHKPLLHLSCHGVVGTYVGSNHQRSETKVLHLSHASRFRYCLERCGFCDSWATTD